MYYTTDPDGYACLEIPLPCFGKGGFLLHDSAGLHQVFHDMSDEMQQIVDKYAARHGWYMANKDGGRMWKVPQQPKVEYFPPIALPIGWVGPSHREQTRRDKELQERWEATAPKPFRPDGDAPSS